MAVFFGPGQRRGPRRVVGQTGLRAAFQQEFRQFGVAVPGRVAQRGGLEFVVAGVDVGPEVEQQAGEGDLLFVLPVRGLAGEPVQQGHVLAVAGFGIGAVFQHHAQDFDLVGQFVALAVGVARLSLPAPSAQDRVDSPEPVQLFQVVLEAQAHQVDVAGQGRGPQDLGSQLRLQSHDLGRHGDATAHGCGHGESLAPVSIEQVQDLVVAVLHGALGRRSGGEHVRIGVGPALQQQLAQRVVAARGRQPQWFAGIAVGAFVAQVQVVRGIGVGAAVEQQAGHFELAELGGQAQREDGGPVGRDFCGAQGARCFDAGFGVGQGRVGLQQRGGGLQVVVGHRGQESGGLVGLWLHRWVALQVFLDTSHYFGVVPVSGVGQGAGGPAVGIHPLQGVGARLEEQGHDAGVAFTRGELNGQLAVLADRPPGQLRVFVQKLLHAHQVAGAGRVAQGHHGDEGVVAGRGLVAQGFTGHVEQSSL